MADLIDEFNRLKVIVAKATATGNTAVLHKKIHVAHLDDEVKRKRTNPAKSVRVVLNCRTPEQWTEFQMAKERFFQIAVDPHLALDLMIRTLKIPNDETLKEWLADGHQQTGDRPAGPPKAELPDWLKP
jgi:hypothetical protein